MGDGLVDNQRLIQLLADADFDGLLAVETDSLHTDYLDEDDAWPRVSPNCGGWWVWCKTAQ